MQAVEDDARDLARLLLDARDALGANALLIVASIAWWGCHYALLWSPTVEAAYSLVEGFDVRFLLSVAGTVAVLLAAAWAARRRGGLTLADRMGSYVWYFVGTVAAYLLMVAPLFTGVGVGAGLVGAVLSGMANSVGMLLYGELHARMEHRFEPLAFAIEMAGGVVVYLAVSLLPTIPGSIAAVALSLAAAVLFAAYARRKTTLARVAPLVRMDLTIGELAGLAFLLGFAYGLIRTFSVGSANAAEGLGAECLGSFLCAVMLAVIFIAQRRFSAFELCLLFVVPLVATGMLLVSLQGSPAMLSGVINTVGFAEFFSLIWYFATAYALRDEGIDVVGATALLFFVCQGGQLLGALVPSAASSVFSSGLIYFLLLGLIVFMFWHLRRQSQVRAVDGEGGGAEETAPVAGLDEGANGFAAPEEAGHVALEASALSSAEPAPLPDLAAALEQAWGLSPREADVALLLAKRIPYRAIAEELVVSENTVKTHARNIYKKADVASREELIAAIAALEDLAKKG